MIDNELNPELASWAEHMERVHGSAAIIDLDWNLAWVSSELRGFLPHRNDDDLGIGCHIVEAFMKESWISIVHPESQIEMFYELAPYMVSDFQKRGRDPRDVLPEQFLPLLDEVEPAEPQTVTTTSFAYVPPDGDPDLPLYRVNMSLFTFRSKTGERLGWLVLCNVDVRPSLATLLVRGDEQMYERMAKLVEPSAHTAAVLFCDLDRSGELSRRMPSSAYFRLIRQLWTGIDAAVAENVGIIGKHAGDGASAFFLVDDLGSDSQGAAAAIRAARKIHEVSEEVFEEALSTEAVMKVGLHWGANLFMGQLIPGGRLDVTALGDEVNEAARIQDSAEPGTTLVSKQLIEHLDDDDAAGLGIDVEKLSYRTVSELPNASEKTIRDAGTIPVTTI